MILLNLTVSTHTHKHRHTRVRASALCVWCHLIRGFCSFSLTSASDPAGLSLHLGPFIRLLQSVTTHPGREGHRPAFCRPPPNHPPPPTADRWINALFVDPPEGLSFFPASVFSPFFVEVDYRVRANESEEPLFSLKQMRFIYYLLSLV